MTNIETREMEEKLRSIVQEYKDKPGALLPLLEKAQALYGCLPLDAQKEIANGMDLPLAHVAGVVSFYSFFHEEKLGRYVIRMCKSAPCRVRGAEDTLKAFEKALGIKDGQTTPDGKFTLETCACLGLCDRAPAVMVNDEVFGPVRPEDAARVLETFK